MKARALIAVEPRCHKFVDLHAAISGNAITSPPNMPSLICVKKNSCGAV